MYQKLGNCIIIIRVTTLETKYQEGWVFELDSYFEFAKYRRIMTPIFCIISIPIIITKNENNFLFHRVTIRALDINNYYAFDATDIT